MLRSSIRPPATTSLCAVSAQPSGSRTGETGADSRVRTIAATAGQTTAENPWPVRLLSAKLTDYVNRAPMVWVEGQVVQLTRRPGQSTCYLTLRDPDVDMSFQVTISGRLLDGLAAPLSDGARVVIQARAQLFPKRGSLSLQAGQIRPVGVGELLAQLEQLRRILAAEGVFDPRRKRPLPFLPATVGLICGRASAAERDVIENARRRWPSVRFDVRPVAVQGLHAVQDVVTALAELDKRPEVEVIVIARGGGSLEDLLPFSNETLIRAVASCRTPVVSAIGHEVDQPLLDLVADLRASTPTDAGRRIVPDMDAELTAVQQVRQRARAAMLVRIQREHSGLAALRARPVMADPQRILAGLTRELELVRDRARRALTSRITHALDDIEHLRQRVLALSPAATLARGYAVVQSTGHRVIRSPGQVSAGEGLIIRVDGGSFAATVEAAGHEQT